MKNIVKNKGKSKTDETLDRWKEVTVQEFLDLSDADMELIEMRVRLTRLIKEKRVNVKLTQEQAARLLKTSQPRFAKIEGGDSSVSFDLLLKSSLRLGISRKQLAEAIA